MKYSYNWLKKLSGTKKSPKDLAQMVALKGFELEELEKIVNRFDNFVVGKILELSKHPNADRLQFVRVDIGGKQISEIVCGAKNIKVDDKIPVALPGSVLPMGNFVIEKTKIRGIISNGMLCAEDELGLGKDHDGIMILDSDAKVGEPLAKNLSIDDSVLEFDILPDRAHDCMSYEGMAREIATMEGRNFKVPKYMLQSSKKMKELEIQIKDSKLCPRYIGAVIENVKIEKSPNWMQAALVASGMEPINNVVDITNYVMLEIGSPLHAFDFEQIQDNGKVSIVVRGAEKNEKLELLDGTNLELDQKDLVIANKQKGLALAGIKGGKDSGIVSDTKKIVLEGANFDGFNIRKSRQRHALLTESQARFEKGISPALAHRAVARAVELFEKYASAKLVEVADEDFSEAQKQTQKLSLPSVTKLLGHEVEKKEIVQILTNLGFETTSISKDELEVAVPYWRLDIEGPEDLIEEVGRIVGYEKIEERPILTPISVPVKNESRELEWKLKQLFSDFGMNEVRNYSFYGKADVENCGIEDKHFELENPLTVDQSLLRKTLLVGLLKNVAQNAKFFEDVMLFEIGKVFDMFAGKKPQEKLMIASAVLLKGKKDERPFYVLKGCMETFLFKALGIEVFFRKISDQKDKIFHRTRSAEVVLEKKSGQVIGRIGQVESVVAKKYGIDGKVMLFEMDFESVRQNFKENVIYRPLQKYPAVLRDISMYAPNRIEAHAVEKVIREAAGSDLLKVDLFDVFVDKAKDKKSLAYHLTFGSDERTLKRKEVDDLIGEIETGLEKIGVKMRKQ
ncbi:MAG: phenylalanine--tRNA ligase subunit beta [Patescibacteria group bacterium]|nr:phenylalanine--tRNA ligase subunit beta [Patescibacteria group bacterium]